MRHFPIRQGMKVRLSGPLPPVLIRPTDSFVDGYPAQLIFEIFGIGGVTRESGVSQVFREKLVCRWKRRKCQCQDQCPRMICPDLSLANQEIAPNKLNCHLLKIILDFSSSRNRNS